MKQKKKLFGTDGVRGIANKYPVDGEIAFKLGQAIALMCRSENLGLERIVVGKDTRLSGYLLESAIISGICSMGMDAMLVGPLPTPGIAFVARSMRARAGVMVSASHNPVEYNGIKFFDKDGFKFPDEVELKMEEMVLGGQLTSYCVGPLELGKAYRIDDAQGRYIQYLKGTFPQDLTLEGLKIILDCANGAGYKVSPAVFTELGAEVVTTAVSPNGLNINCDSGALHPNRMAKLVREHKANVGIALDGDADRVIMCDENGNIVDGDTIIALCASHLKINGALAKNTVVGTSMSNMGLEVFLRERGISFIRTDVGDKYVIDVMRRENLELGGEPSGHIIFLSDTTSGDGVLAALRVLSVMCRQQKPLSEVAGVFRPFPQVINNVGVRERLPIADMKNVATEVALAEKELGNRGRLVVRYSGTEDIARVMVEGENESDISAIAARIVDAIKLEIGLA